MTKFNAKEFSKHGFVHVKDEDFSDDGTWFQIWMHEETGLKVSYARGNWDGETEYFISPRESYYEHGLLYSDICDEPEWKDSDKFNGCYEVDVAELVELLKARHEMFLRVKAVVDDEEIELGPLYVRAYKEMAALRETMQLAKNAKWWELGEWELKNAARNMKWMERAIDKLQKLVDEDFGDHANQRKLAHQLELYGFIVDKLEDGSEYGYYKELRELASK